MTCKNHLGIFGDSFASDYLSPNNIYGEPWVLTLSKLLNIDFTLYALHGTSIWWSFNNFLKHYKDFSHIVFAYSQHNRWHSMIKEYETMHYVTVDKGFLDNISDEKYDIAKMLVDVYPIVSSEDFDLYVYQKIFDDVNRICRDNGIKLINFMPFDNGSLINYSNRSGSCIYNAIGLTSLEQQQLNSVEKEQFIKMVFSGDLRYCHMNWKNNKMVANRMYENLNNSSVMIDVIKDAEVSDDPNCIKELLNLYDKRKK